MAPRKKPLVVVTRKLPDRVETRMCELFDTRLNLADKPMTPSELILLTNCQTSNPYCSQESL